ncbi:MAG: hypothetical protein AAF384_06685 [Pseudomonadota bacterium]
MKDKPTTLPGSWAATALLLAVFSTANATQTTFEFSGTVTSLSGGLIDDFILGDTISGSFTVDTDSIWLADQFPTDNTIRKSFSPVIQLSISLAQSGHTWQQMVPAGSFGGTFTVRNDASAPFGFTVDSVSTQMSTAFLTATAVEGRTPAWASVILESSIFGAGDPGMLTGIGIPTSPLAFESGGVSFFYEPDSTVSSIGFAPLVIPIPAPMVLLISGIAGVAGFARRGAAKT